MHMMFRTLLHYFFHGRRGPRLGFGDVSRSSFRVMPTDLDLLRHVNNGVYLSIMDVARFDMLQRNGVMAIFSARGWYPVVVAETISFRKSLQLWEKFTIESKMLGFDDQAVFLDLLAVSCIPVIKTHYNGRDVGQIDQRADAEGED